MFWGIKSALDLVRAQRAEQVDAKFLAHIPIDLGMYLSLVVAETLVVLERKLPSCQIFRWI
ncbi:hypothetical protein METH_08235 [Leisingera methylohalidivorans DSM 14336]|uniref:Uncharacterized protein n=1 Tax=Leisingera methylohalidivorans DSM 14336 TaxID=999552 RepID=V9VYG8_9RHOB|nr:hypothetical protein METH_08235 [Leisingera methylohalidivorans DSM 14336]